MASRTAPVVGPDTRPDDPPEGTLEQFLESDAEVVDAELVDDPATPAVVANGPGTALAVPTDDDPQALVQNDEWGDVDSMDLSPSDRFIIPLYQLNRKVDGGFLNEDTGETVREIEAVLMAKVNTRAWWPQQFGKGDAAPSCRSSDGVTPDVERSPAQAADWQMPTRDLRGGEKPGTACATCPNGQWDGDNPPPCSEALEFLAFVPTTHGAGKVVRLRFSGMGFGPARTYWESFKTRLPARPPIAYLTHITLEEVDTPNGTFLVPMFRRSLELNRQAATPILEARAQRAEEWRTAIATDERPAEVIDARSTEQFGDEEPF